MNQSSYRSEDSTRPNLHHDCIHRRWDDFDWTGQGNPDGHKGFDNALFPVLASFMLVAMELVIMLTLSLAEEWENPLSPPGRWDFAPQRFPVLSLSIATTRSTLALVEYGSTDESFDADDDAPEPLPPRHCSTWMGRHSTPERTSIGTTAESQRLSQRMRAASFADDFDQLFAVDETSQHENNQPPPVHKASGTAHNHRVSSLGPSVGSPQGPCSPVRSMLHDVDRLPPGYVRRSSLGMRKSSMTDGSRRSSDR